MDRDLFGPGQQAPRTHDRREAAALVEVLKVLGQLKDGRVPVVSPSWPGIAGMCWVNSIKLEESKMTEPKVKGPRRWKAGESGNPAGRKPGTGVVEKNRTAIAKRVTATESVSVFKAQAGFFPEIDDQQPTTRPARFDGTDDPCELRALLLLVRRPSVPLEVMAREAGCANGPDLVARLRSYGLGQDHLPCSNVTVVDCAGCCWRIDAYHLTPEGCRAVLRWFRKPRQKGAA